MNEQSARLINANEFQEKIFDYALSDKLDKMIENTIFSDDQKCKSAIIQGMIIASMIISECNSIYIDVDSMIPIENFEKSVRDETIDEFAKRIFTTAAPIGENNIEHLQNIVKEIVSKMKAEQRII